MSDRRLDLKIRVEHPGFTLDIDEALPLSGVTAVFGASGAGKTTLLRAIAGFARPTAGRIAVGETIWFDAQASISLPPHKRNAGYVFQDARLFPHLSVTKNLRYADKRSRSADSRYAFDDIVRRFALGPLLDRNTTSLSGGEARRVALARTLLSRPSVLLLDEPLAGLDWPAKRDLLPFLEALPTVFGAPVLYVSHDVYEVRRLADAVLVLKEGRKAAYGATGDLIDAVGAAAGDRSDKGSLVEATIAEHDERLNISTLRIGGDVISLPMIKPAPIGAKLRLFIRAHDVALSTVEPSNLSIRNVMKGSIVRITSEENAAFADVEVQTASTRLRAQVTRAAVEALGLDPGAEVYALIKSAALDDANL